MANDLGHNPWSVDTASATAIWSYPIKLKKLLWHEPSAAAATCEVKDKDGNVVWSKYALAGGSGMDYELDLDGAWVKGLIVSTISSGTLFIYLDT